MRRLYPLLLLLGGCLTACGPDLREGVTAAMAELPERIDYNFDVKPILSDRCFACHGPDAENQEAGLRLDTPEGAYAALASGEGVAIAPGKPASSELVHRINSTDPAVMMPTPESRLSLSVREIAVLTKWVEQGAEYRPHWAFQPPVRPELPAAGADWATSPIDRFIAAKLEREGVAPSPEADRPYLIRRAFFDLTGLPPTLAEIDRWEQHPEADWYDRMVAELLDRPAYGERMAAYWMDVARFADSEGYLDDFHHEMWPYRDWVIRAYNENLPYDRFIEWQLGGDQLEEPTRDQVLATAFNRNHKQNSEGGIIAEEFRVEYVADRANTVGTAFLGLTVGCARCHDHKYDPISQRDYYELFAFFNDTQERGDAIFGLNATRNNDSLYHRLSMNAGPTLPLPDSATAAIYDHLRDMIDRREGADDLAPSSDPAPASAPRYDDIAETVRQATVHHLTFDQDPVRDLAPRGELRWNQLERAPGKYGQSLLLDEGSLVTAGEASHFEHSDPFTVSFWLHPGGEHPEGHLLYNGNNRIQGYRGWDVVLDSNRVHFRLSHAHPYQSLDVMDEQPLVADEWVHYVWSYDGSGDARGMRIYRNGASVPATIKSNHLLRSTVPFHGDDNVATLYMGYQGLTFGGRHYDLGTPGARVDDFRVLDREAGDLIARYLHAEREAPLTAPSAAESREFADLHRDPERARARDTLRQLRRRAIATIDTVREVMVMGDDPLGDRTTYVLDRGMYDAHGRVVHQDIPESILPWPQGLPRNRLGLGRWLTHPDNPLTARVAVNQIWYLYFGRGLVESVEDFGNQGALPSHPELLDWLAVDFRENGWDVKRLVRQLVTSSTYRQSSVVRPELADRDPDNRWLARAPRYRRSAEMIRDNVLAASGLLDRRVGGASAFPYQPPGLWREASNHGFSTDYQVDPDGLYRRSLYTFFKRNVPTPMMMTFDASLRGECQVRRTISNTPLQALVLLNDPQVVEACRVLAARSLADHGNEVASARAIFRTLTGRPPTAEEAEVLLQYFESELNYFDDHPLATADYLATGADATEAAGGAARLAAMARLAGVVVNSTEGFYKN